MTWSKFTYFACDEDILTLDASSFETFFDAFSAFDLVTTTRAPQHSHIGPAGDNVLDLGQVEVTVAVLDISLQADNANEAYPCLSAVKSNIISQMLQLMQLFRTFDDSGFDLSRS